MELVPPRRIGCCTLWIRPSLSITYSLTYVLWAVSNHMPTFTATETGISALSALSTMSAITLSTFFWDAAFNLYCSSWAHVRSFRCCTPLGIRISKTLMPLFEHGLLTDTKINFYGLHG